MATVTIIYTCDNCGKQHTEVRNAENVLYGIGVPKGWKYTVSNDTPYTSYIWCSSECAERKTAQVRQEARIRRTPHDSKVIITGS